MNYLNNYVILVRTNLQRDMNIAKKTSRCHLDIIIKLETKYEYVYRQ